MGGRKMKIARLPFGTSPITAEGLAWSAGFLEGEGSFSFKSSIAISASQVQLWPLMRLQSLFGGSIQMNGRPKPRCQPCRVWYLHGHRAAAVMMTLYTFMSPRRQQQIRLSLKRWKPLQVANALRQSCPKGHPYRRLPNSTRRYCPTCSNAHHQRWLQTKQEASSCVNTII
jgi:hypothetical protein